MTERRQPGTPKVLIVNLHSNRNAGDAAALEVAIGLIREAFPQVQISLSMNDPNSYSEGTEVEVLGSFFTISPQGSRGAVNYHRLLQMPTVLAESLWAALWFRLSDRPYVSIAPRKRDLIRAYTAADLVISGPGGIFLSRGRMGLPFLASLFRAAYALMLGKPLCVLPQSIGPLGRSWERWLMRWLLSRAAVVFVRDVVSFRLLQGMGLTGPQYRLSPDIVFALAPAPRDEGSLVLRKYGIDTERDRPLLGWTAVNPIVRYIGKASWKSYEDILSRVIPRFVRKYGGKAIFFPQTTGPTEIEDDRRAARRIIGRMGVGRERVVLVDEPLRPSLFKSVYGLMDIFVATRMHAGIFAMGVGVPTLVVGYNLKAEGIMEMLNLGQWVVAIDCLEEDSVWLKLEALWEKRDEVRGHLMDRMPALVDQIDRIGGIIAEDFYGR